MGNQFSLIITQFNSIQMSKGFTSTNLKSICNFPGVNPKSVESFINTAYRMQAIGKEPIPSPGKGPRVLYKKLRSITKEEAFKLTTWEQCIDFKKEIDKAYHKRLRLAAQVKRVVKVKAKKKDNPILVKAHGQKTNSKQTLSISETKDKIIVTVFK